MRHETVWLVGRYVSTATACGFVAAQAPVGYPYLLPSGVITTERKPVTGGGAACTLNFLHPENFLLTNPNFST